MNEILPQQNGLIENQMKAHDMASAANDVFDFYTSEDEAIAIVNGAAEEGKDPVDVANEAIDTAVHDVAEHALETGDLTYIQNTGHPNYSSHNRYTGPVARQIAVAQRAADIAMNGLDMKPTHKDERNKEMDSAAVQVGKRYDRTRAALEDGYGRED